LATELLVVVVDSVIVFSVEFVETEGKDGDFEVLIVFLFFDEVCIKTNIEICSRIIIKEKKTNRRLNFFETKFF
jgi:hypothetical protein